MTKVLSLAVFTAIAVLASAPARAESSASSAVSDSASSATSSASNSLEGSSNSSSGNNKKVAAGEYRVIQMAAATDKPGQQQRVLLRKDDGSEVRLLLPLAAAERGQLAAGRMVLVNERPYGYEFAAADTKQAFFLVLEDAWQRDLQTRPVVL